jgi:hypothetical protein
VWRAIAVTGKTAGRNPKDSAIFRLVRRLRDPGDGPPKAAA